MVQEGRADAIFTAYQTPEREKLLDYCTEDLLPQVLYFYVKKGSEITFEGDLAALKGKKIGVGQHHQLRQPVRSVEGRPPFADREGQPARNRTSRSCCWAESTWWCPNVYTGDYTIRKMGLEGEIVKVPQQIESVPRLRRIFQETEPEGIAGQVRPGSSSN